MTLHQDGATPSPALPSTLLPRLERTLADAARRSQGDVLRVINQVEAVARASTADRPRDAIDRASR